MSSTNSTIDIALLKKYFQQYAGSDEFLPLTSIDLVLNEAQLTKLIPGTLTLFNQRHPRTNSIDFDKFAEIVKTANDIMITKAYMMENMTSSDVIDSDPYSMHPEKYKATNLSEYASITSGMGLNSQYRTVEDIDLKSSNVSSKRLNEKANALKNDLKSKKSIDWQAEYLVDHMKDVYQFNLNKQDIMPNPKSIVNIVKDYKTFIENVGPKVMTSSQREIACHRIEGILNRMNRLMFMRLNSYRKYDWENITEYKNNFKPLLNQVIGKLGRIDPVLKELWTFHTTMDEVCFIGQAMLLIFNTFWLNPDLLIPILVAGGAYAFDPNDITGAVNAGIAAGQVMGMDPEDVSKALRRLLIALAAIIQSILYILIWFVYNLMTALTLLGMLCCVFLPAYWFPGYIDPYDHLEHIVDMTHALNELLNAYRIIIPNPNPEE